MDFRTAFTLFQALHGDRCSFGYSGSFPDEHTARLIDLGSAVLEAQGFSTVARGRLGYVMVEAYQNIVRHSAELPPDTAHYAGRGLFLLRCHDTGQQVLAMNTVTKRQALDLQEALQGLKEKSMAQLKELFLVGLQRSVDSGSRGAGLGLIEMARRSGHAPAWMMHDLDETHKLFLIALGMGREETPSETAVKEAFGLHDPIAIAGVRFFHLGLRPPGVEEALLRLIEKESGGGPHQRSAHSRALLASMGMARQTNEGPEQLLAYCEVEGRYSILFGSVMSEEGAAQLGEHVGELANWDGMRLQRAYQEALLGRDTTSIPVGLIELARIAPEPLLFEALPTAEGPLAMVRSLL